MISVTDSIIK